MITDSVSEKRSPLGSTSEPAPAPPVALGHAAGDLEGAGVQAVVGDELDLDRAHEGVALVAGVLAGGVAELPGQAVLHALELLEVARPRAHTVKALGTTVPPRTPTERLSSISRTSRRPELDGPQPALEGAGEDALDQALQAAFEPTDPHRRSRLPGAALRAGASAGGRRYALPLHSGEWRNWQTRWLQVPVSERTWGFKSPLAHSSGRSPRFGTATAPASSPRDPAGLVR